MKKNTATKWIVFAFDRTDNTPKTGDAANITANVRIDGAAANAVDDTNPTELEDGYYIFDITAAECDGDLIVICPASTTADIQVIGVPGAVWTDTLAADIAALPTAASVADLPTVAEFEARTLVAADYTVVSDLPAAAPTLVEIEGSAVLAKEATVAALSFASQASVDLIAADTAAILVDTGATLDAKIDSILTDTNELQTDLTNGGRLDLLVDAILLDTGTTLDNKITVVDGKADTISTAVVTTIPAAVAVVDGIVDAILVDTNELQTMLTPDGTLDVILDSILADTAALGAADPAAIADAVWDEAAAGHVAAGSMAAAVAAAASAGDPWVTPIPGVYAVGTAGKKVADMVAEVTAILVDTGTTLNDKIDVVDANVDAILVDTGTTLDTKINTIDGIVDAIVVDTGTDIPATLAGLGITTPPTAAAIADAVWDEVITSGHAVGNSAAVKLAAAAAGLATAQAGLGAVTNVITVTIEGVPLLGCDVWVTSDLAGTTVVAGTLQTDASGHVTFYLDAGTYYVWQQKTGYNFTNPDELIVT